MTGRDPIFYDKRRVTGLLAMAISANLLILEHEKKTHGDLHYDVKWWHNFYSLTYGLSGVYGKI